MPGSMRLTFLVSLAGDGVLFVTLWKYELASKHASIRLRALQRRLAGDEDRWPPTRAARRRPAALMPALPLDEAGHVRRRRLPRLPRADPDLRGDHGRASWRASSASWASWPSSSSAATRRASDEREPVRAMSELLALGASHKTAPLALRERLALPTAQAERVPARAAWPTPAIAEAVVALDLQPHRALPRRRRPGRGRDAPCSALLARRAGMRPTELLEAIYSLRNCDAARHLYRVASGLESMIVGEAEVQGQVKRAYERALAARTTGPLTNQLFRAALATGKRVRTETAISAGRASRRLGRGRRRARRARRPRPRATSDHRRRRDRRADRAGAARRRA